MRISRWKHAYWQNVWLITNSWQFTFQYKAVILLAFLSNIPGIVFPLDTIRAYLGLPDPFPFPGIIRVIALYALYLFFSIIGLWGKAAIIHMVKLANGKEGNLDSATLVQGRNIFKISRNMLERANSNMPSLIKLSLILFGFAGAIFALNYLIAFYLADQSSTGYLLYRISTQILAYPGILVFNILWNQSTVALVVEDLPPMVSIRRSWLIIIAHLRKHIGISLITWILFGLAFLLIRAISLGLYNSAPSINMLPYLLTTLAGIIVYGIYDGFYNVVWTRVFLQFTQSPQEEVDPEHVVQMDESPPHMWV